MRDASPPPTSTGYAPRAPRPVLLCVLLVCGLAGACGDSEATTSDGSPDTSALLDVPTQPEVTEPLDTADTAADTAGDVDTSPDPDTTTPTDGLDADTGTPDTAVGPTCTSPFIYLRDKQFRLGDEPWVPISVNFIFDIRHTPEDEYYIAPHHAGCETPAGCCNDAPTCLAAAREHLAQVKAMGLNSVRIIGLAVIPEDGTVVLDCSYQRPTWLDYCPKSSRLVMSPPDPRGMALIADAVALVEEAGLRAILLAGHADVDAEGVRDHYASYLTALATRFADDPTLFAYDLTNEPVYEFADKTIDKVDANAIGRAWYDAVRAGSSRHMVTMGLAEIGTVRHWDPGALPLDFTSFHIYGSGIWSAADRDYVSMFLAWAGREPYPSMVGEIGLSLEDGGPTEADQRAFAQHALSTAWACGSMGLQWWLYRDVNWGPPGEHFGLVRRDGTVRSTAAAFADFRARIPRPSCPVPAYLGSSPNGTTLTTGRLVREDGSPVANGFVSGHKCVTGGWDWTISAADGTFELRSDAPIHELEATASGLSFVQTEVACGFLPAGDITLRALPLSMSVSTPSECPQ